MRVPVKLLGFVFWLFFFNCGQCQAKQQLCPDLSVENGFTYSPPSNEEEIFYSCDTGYKPFTGNWWDSVTCREGSWSEEPRCIPVEECGALPRVPHGKPKKLEKTFRGGKKTAFECDPGFKSTPRLITCRSGTWETPVCEGCGNPPKVENAFIASKPEEFYVDGSSVAYACRSSFSMNGRSTVSCRNGIWGKTPTCEDVTCVANLPANMRSDRHLGPEDPIRPGDTITLSCDGDGLELRGRSEITCRPNGEWDVSPFPECVKDLTCPLNTTEEDLIIERFPNTEGPVKPGHKVKFSCNRQRLKLKGQSEIICHSNGEWSSPFPKCEEVTCVANLPANMKSDRHLGPEVSVRPGDTITLSCNGDGLELRGRNEITCRPNGEWSFPLPKCVGGKCGRPPHVDFADTTEMLKNEYDSEERVEYMCYNKYTLDQRYPYSKYKTCEQGEWTGNIKCLKPCTVTVDEMDERGIELRWGGRQKIFSEHEDRITFACQWGKNLRDNELIQTCNDGEMILPVCV